ncbi:hypothetical protein DNH61_19835 [Paenibacillus sambharensis]|uniref:SLH domain-containing protein n=1 Tax=Paenibacillus sambharensis TaxID=1803190 RepID=A0A2W1LGQ0_9BACL|nr:hypothetical protein DNH61_19835 [Paenibacillus sambharensis]
MSVVIAFSLAAPAAASISPSGEAYLPPGGPDWNKLADIEVMTDTFGGWGYGVEAGAGNFLPADTADGKLAARIKTTGWWAANLITNGWQTKDLTNYYENGIVEFDIKGSAGSGLKLGFIDVVHERQKKDGTFYPDTDDRPHDAETKITVLSENINQYASVTDQWQRVSIPVKDIADQNEDFYLSRVQLLTITGVDDSPVDVSVRDIRITSTDKEPSYAPIKVNQVGYLPGVEKYALISGYYNELSAEPGTAFEVKRASDNSTVFTGELTLVAAYDPASGEKVLRADFTPVRESGTYYVSVEGVAAQSAPFRIGGDIYADLLKDVQKFFYFQRANAELLAEHAGDFAREARHMGDADAPLQSNPSIRKNMSGGWYDAGDYGKYVTAGATAVSDLLWAYETYPGLFTDGQLNIPESGNGIPDLLDEIKYETDFFLRMQDDATGGFYSYMIREEARMVMDGTGNTSVIPTAQTAATVGALAHASLVFAEVEGLEAYAAEMLAAAQKGWTFLAANPQLIPQPDGPYNDNEDVNDRFYAAAALYRATGEQQYNDFVKAHYADFTAKFEEETFSHGIGGMEMVAYYHYMSSSEPDADVKTWFTEQYKKWRSSVLDTSYNTVWRNSTDEGFYWGANSNVASVPFSLAVGSKLIGEYDYRNIEVAQANLNYLLGVNPLQLSFITGYGDHRVRITHSEIFMRDYVVEMPNGYMPGGPNNWKAKFPAKAYNASTVDWESNEQALNYNSPLIFLTAMLLNQGDQLNVPVEEPGPTEPGSTEPGTTEPGTTEPGTTEPGTTEPGTTEPGTTEPGTPGKPSPIPNPPLASQTNSSAPAAAASGKIEGSKVTVNASVNDNGKATAALTEADLRKAAAGASRVTIAVEKSQQVNATDIVIPAAWLRSADKSVLQSVEFTAGDVTAVIDAKLLMDRAEGSADKIVWTVASVPVSGQSAAVQQGTGGNMAYSISLSVDGKPAAWQARQAAVTIPYTLKAGETADHIIVRSVTSGSQAVVKNAVYAAASGTITFYPEKAGTYAALHNHVKFNDTSAYTWAEKQVEWLASRDVVSGTGMGAYQPQAKLTRAEFIHMLMGGLGLADVQTSASFTDVKQDGWYYQSVANAEKLGIITGKPDGTFGVHEEISRQDMAVMMAQAIKASGGKLASSGSSSAFRDHADISGYAADAVSAMYEAGLISGLGNNTFSPKQSATRAQAAVILYNMMTSGLVEY